MTELGFETRSDGSVGPITQKSQDISSSLSASANSIKQSTRSLAKSPIDDPPSRNPLTRITSPRDGVIKTATGSDVPVVATEPQKPASPQTAKLSENTATQIIKPLSPPPPSQPIVEPPPRVPTPKVEIANPRTGSPPLPAYAKNKQAQMTEYPDGVDPASMIPKGGSQPPTRVMSAAPRPPPARKSKENLSSKKSNPVLNVSESAPSPNTTHAFMNEDVLPSDLEALGLMSQSDHVKFQYAADAFGELVAQYSVSIKFPCREWGLGRVLKKLGEWENKSLGMNRVVASKRDKGKSEPVESKGAIDPNDWVSFVDLLPLVKGTMQVVTTCLEDTREKSNLLTLDVAKKLLEVVSRFSPEDIPVFKCFSGVFFDTLIAKAGELNPRLKAVSYPRAYEDYVLTNFLGSPRPKP